MLTYHIPTAPSPSPSLLPQNTALPEPVRQTREAIYNAAKNNDYTALAQMATPPFNYSFGGEVAGGFKAFLERPGMNHGERISNLLTQKSGKIEDIYVWPEAFATEEYYDWRIGIRSDGHWLYYIAGD